MSGSLPYRMFLGKNYPHSKKILTKIPALDSTLYCIVLCYHQSHMSKETKDYIENAQAQMRKGILELCTLLAIKETEEMYASDILEKLKKKDLLVVEGTLYPLLNRLRSENILTYSWQESKSGPPRKYYRLTKEGKVTLEELEKNWKHLENIISSFR